MRIKILGIKFTFTEESYKKPFKIAKRLYKVIMINFIYLPYTFVKQIYAMGFYACINYLKQIKLIPPPIQVSDLCNSKERSTLYC